MENKILLYHLIVKLTAILGGSLIIERVLSFLNKAINRMFLFQYSNNYTQAEKLQEQLVREKQASREEQLLLVQSPNDKHSAEIAANPDLPNASSVNSNFDLLLIKPLSKTLDDSERFEKYKENNLIVKEFWMQIIGTLLAVILCRIFNFSIWEFFRNFSADSAAGSPVFFEYIFTGIIIGSGSKPINFLINFLINRKIETEIEEVRAEASNISELKTTTKTEIAKTNEPTKTTQELIPESIEEIIGFTYDGGDRPQRLENTHQYSKPFDTIVYHHTCLHSDAPFEEIVKELDRKGWLTGYNCVVFSDGSIRPLCRWDRFGNHASGHNLHSFGLAFQGNFESNAHIPFSNPTGKLGIKAPTKKQIEAAARVTALIAILHKIPLNFPKLEPNDVVKGIIPHYMIANKACPGSNFPHNEFKNSIFRYYNAWKDNAEFNSALETFKNRPMVYPKNI